MKCVPVVISIVRHDADVLSVFHYLHFVCVWCKKSHCVWVYFCLQHDSLSSLKQNNVAIIWFQATKLLASLDMDGHNVDQ